jgi:hypothetical protein
LSSSERDQQVDSYERERETLQLLLPLLVISMDLVNSLNIRQNQRLQQQSVKKGKASSAIAALLGPAISHADDALPATSSQPPTSSTIAASQAAVDRSVQPVASTIPYVFRNVVCICFMSHSTLCPAYRTALVVTGRCTPSQVPRSSRQLCNVT